MEPRVALPPRVSAAALGRLDPARPVTRLAGEALGTSWRVSGVGEIDGLRGAIEARLAVIVAEMSQWAPDSLLSRFNRSPAGTWMALPPDFATVVAAALAIAARSGGAFDPTQGGAAALLGHGPDTPAQPPTAAMLDEAHAAAGWCRLAFDCEGSRLRQPGGLWLDFAGIAKGHAVDMVADLLREAGIEDALVEIGGELVGRGLRPDGQPWWVDLETPPAAAIAPLRVALHDQAVATSGDYVRGAHTLDPRTGRPLDGVVVSVSVIHPRAMLADAWATALTVLGADEGIRLATREDLAARIVTRRSDGFAETLSPALAAMLAD